MRFDAGSRAAYAHDSSNYRQPPIGVVIPRTPDAAVEAVAVCRDHDVPVFSRGGGTSLAGQCCNAGVVIDWSKYCRRLISVDPDRRQALVEPGACLDDLNAELSKYELMVGPKPSTHDTCTIGGMIGNNSCGASAQAYGKMADSVVRMEVLTYDGTRMWVGPTSKEAYERILAEGGRRAEIYRALRGLAEENLALIRTRYPDIPRRVSGYNLDALLPENGFNLARALVGSESTLVTVLQAEIALVPVPPYQSLVVLGFDDIAAAGDAVPAVAEHEPLALEGVDDTLIDLARVEHVAKEGVLRELPEGSGWLMVRFGPDTHEGWEDAAVPPERLGDYLRDFKGLLGEFDYGSASLYGHFGQGCVHTRIAFDLGDPAGTAAYRRFAERAAHLVASYGGSLSGEHGDGQSRAELLPIMFGEEIVGLFGRCKQIFDPRDRMNPGKVASPREAEDPSGTPGVYRLDDNLDHLGYHPREPRTHFDYPKDHGRFTHAAARCVGIGKCRSSSGGVMCPSYRVTHEEKHTTRGRARLLMEMMHGMPGGGEDAVITDGWRSKDVHDALDLCLACKGCRGDCPVNVDMATYKAEFLSHHYRRRLRPPSHYSMGWLPLWARVAAVAPGAVNTLLRAPLLDRVIKRAGGVDHRRELPRFARQRLTDWFKARGGSATDGPPVILWPDSFTNNFHPAIGQAAVRVLEAAGVQVEVLDEGCCGLAGNFGFERGHYEVSVGAAELGVWPAVRDADPDTTVLADGFSCRTQIEAGTQAKPKHLAELLAELL